MPTSQQCQILFRRHRYWHDGHRISGRLPLRRGIHGITLSTVKLEFTPIDKEIVGVKVLCFSYEPVPPY